MGFEAMYALIHFAASGDSSLSGGVGTHRKRVLAESIIGFSPSLSSAKADRRHPQGRAMQAYAEMA